MPDLTDVIVSAVSLLIPLVGVALGLLTKYLAGKVRNEALSHAISRLDEAAMLVVQDVWDSYVKHLKQARLDGQLTSDEKAYARQLALERLIGWVSAKGAARIAAEIAGPGAGVEEVLGGAIDRAVKKAKTESRLGSITLKNRQISDRVLH